MKTKHIGKAVHAYASGNPPELDTHERVVTFAKRTQPQFNATLSLRLGDGSDLMQGVLAGPRHVRIKYAKKVRLLSLSSSAKSLALARLFAHKR